MLGAQPWKITWFLKCIVLCALLLTASPPHCLCASEASKNAILPPAQPWNGKSRSLIAPKDHPWITPAEQSNFQHSPGYEETITWIKRLVAAAPQLKLLSLGKSPEGRDLWMVIASKERAFTPKALHDTRKPILLAQAGIHAGEIDGKDAGLMLLRDLTVGLRDRRLLDGANFLFVPIFNVDGHERVSKFGRINQRGPEETGWRTTSRNLNLNRDYTKLDAPEMQAMIRAIVQWEPDLYLDLHVTDGADFRYDVTYGNNGPHAWSPSIATWLDRVLSPALQENLKAMGHIPGPLIFAESEDLAKGIIYPTSGPRFSTGYADARHLATMLVENHALKPYEQRVLSTYMFLQTCLAVLGESGTQLREATSRDRSLRRQKMPLSWKIAVGSPPTFDLLGIESQRVPSAISGGLRTIWTGKPVSLRVPYFQMTQPAAEASRPKAYWIPPAWTEVIERLQIHGIKVERIAESRQVDVEMARLEDPKLAPKPFEGHTPVTSQFVVAKRRERFPAGSVRVPTDQPLGDLAMLLLEPTSPDSFLQWGFFHEILQQTEYVDNYIIEPMAEQMLAEEPVLAEEFKRRLEEDEAFRSNAKERLQWFYHKTPFFDERWLLYPVGKEF